MERLSQSRPDSAYDLWKTLLQQASQKGNSQLEASCLYQMGTIHLHFGQYNLAFDYLLRAEAIQRSLKNLSGLAETLNSMGNVYYYNQQREKAMELFREAFTLGRELRNPMIMANSLGNLGRMFEKRMDYDSALYYQQQALRWAMQISNKNLLAGIYENIGSIWEDKSVFDSAWGYYRQAFSLYKESFNDVALPEVMNNLGDILRKTGRQKEGLVWTQTALKQALQTDDLYQQNSATRDLAKGYHELGMDDSAYFFLEKSRELMQEIYAVETGRQTALLQAFYDSERKDVEIERLQAQRRLGFTVTIAAVAVVLLASLLGWLYVSKQKLRNRAEKELAAQRESTLTTQQHLMEMELRNKQLQEEKLKQALEVKSNELSSHILHLIQKNEVLEEIKSGLAGILKNDKRDQRKELKTLYNSINQNFSRDHYWDEFRAIFDQVHGSFFRQATANGVELSPTELRLMALIKMDISSQDTATLLGITPDSLRVTRYRLKKKLGLDGNASLSAFVKSLA